MPLTPYGLREWLTITIIALAMCVVAALLGWWWVAAVVAVVWAMLMSFFRDPIRRIPPAEEAAPGAMLAPGDGVVTAVERVEEHDATGGPAVIIRVFMSVLNVHVNRSPCSGEVLTVEHTPGAFLNAQRSEAARRNENTLILLRTAGDETIGIRQIAGLVARRIVCRLDPGDRVRRGQKFGMVKFGSATELILPRPDAVTVHVKKGSKIKGGVTRLATLAPESES